jgi:hypothetical protein
MHVITRHKKEDQVSLTFHIPAYLFYRDRLDLVIENILNQWSSY